MLPPVSRAVIAAASVVTAVIGVMAFAVGGADLNQLLIHTGRAEAAPDFQDPSQATSSQLRR